VVVPFAMFFGLFGSQLREITSHCLLSVLLHFSMSHQDPDLSIPL